MKEEFYDISFRKKIYRSLEELQQDVDEWLKKYNEYRPHSGRFCYGKTPLQTFQDARHIAIDKNHGNMPSVSDSFDVADIAA